MMRRAAFALTIVPLALAVGSCGLHPLYAGGSVSPVVVGLSAVQVGPIPERAGWLVRNALVDRLGSEAPGHPPATYRLDVQLDDQITGFGIRGDSATTRERRTIRARYQLVTVATGETVVDATAGSDSGIDVVSSEYATVAAEQTATERLATVVADQIVGRLGVYLHRQGKSSR